MDISYIAFLLSFITTYLYAIYLLIFHFIFFFEFISVFHGIIVMLITKDTKLKSRSIKKHWLQKVTTNHGSFKVEDFSGISGDSCYTDFTSTSFRSICRTDAKHSTDQPTMGFHLHLWTMDATRFVVVTWVLRRSTFTMLRNPEQMRRGEQRPLVKNWIYLRVRAWNSNSTRNIHSPHAWLSSHNRYIRRRWSASHRYTPTIASTVDSIGYRENRSLPDRNENITLRGISVPRLKVPPWPKKKELPATTFDSFIKEHTYIRAHVWHS